MKKILLTTALAGLFLFSACTSSETSSVSTPDSESSSTAPSSQSTVSSEASSAQEDTQSDLLTYYGRVDEVDTENNTITVSQAEGQTSGNETIVFQLAEDTEIESGGFELAVDAFVAVHYDGILTRSIPPMGTVSSLDIIASFSEGVVQNGTISEVMSDENGYMIHIIPFTSAYEEDAAVAVASIDTSASIDAVASATADTSNVLILNVPMDALVDLSEEDLVPGAEISAVTQGISTMSMPPQMPVIALMPYTA